MGKGKGKRICVDENRRRCVEFALVQVGQIAEQMISHPYAAHDFVALKENLDKLYKNANLAGVPKDIRESFHSIFNTTSQIVDMAIREGVPKEASILDRPLRGIAPKSLTDK